MIINIFLNSILPFCFAVSLFLSISTNLRASTLPVGPGELMLLLLSIYGFKYIKINTKKIIFYVNCWIVILMSMGLGYVFESEINSWSAYHGAAYFFAAFVSIGLFFLLQSFSVKMLEQTILWLCGISAFCLWFGLIVYVFGGDYLTSILYLVDEGDARYVGWSRNANQLALFCIPLPFWCAALFNKCKAGFIKVLVGVNILALLLIGFIVRSDGLFLAWLVGAVVLFLASLKFKIGLTKSTSIYFVSSIIISVAVVATFVQGDVRKSISCVFETFKSGNVIPTQLCLSAQSIKNNGSNIGYGDPIAKTQLRIEIWRNGLVSWSSSPFVGHGPGRFSWYSINDLRSDPWESHNLIIDLMTQGGVFAALAWIFSLIYLIFKAWSYRDSWSISILFMVSFFTLFHNTRQPYLWVVLVLTYELSRRRVLLK